MISRRKGEMEMEMEMKMKILRPEYEIEYVTLYHRLFIHYHVCKTVFKIGILKVQPTLKGKPFGKPLRFIAFPKLNFKKVKFE